MARDPSAWQEIAAEDPEWVVLSLPAGKHGRWDSEALRRTGDRAVAHLLEVAERHAGPLGAALAVDVGCGVGRLAAALADRFDRVVGIDVTPAMLERARELVRVPGVTFLQADITRDVVPVAGTADLAVSERVLQHLPADAVAGHLRALVGLLRPGGVAVVQVPVRLPWLVRLEPRRRLWDLGRRLGLSPRILYWRLGLHPMRMRTVPPAVIAAAAGPLADVVGVETQHEPTFGVDEAVVVVRRRG